MSSAPYVERFIKQIFLDDLSGPGMSCGPSFGHYSLSPPRGSVLVGIAPSTANLWLSTLEASGQIGLLEPWFSNRTKSIVKSPKLYLADTGLLCTLLNVGSAEALRESPAAGAIWETFVFA
jgi:predicted AAA+ superfamily ATPase